MLRVRGTQYVIVETPAGWRTRVPEEWTDRVVTPPPPVVEGRQVRTSVSGLVALADLIEGLEATLDPASGIELVSRKDAEDEDADPRGSADHVLGDAEPGRAEGAPRRMGQPGSPDAARRGTGRGGVR